MSGIRAKSAKRLRPAEVNLGEGEIRILESHHDAEFAMELGRWPFRKICWVAVGKGRLEGPRHSASIGKDDFLLLPANWPHRFVDDRKEPLTLVILCLSERLFDSANDDWEALWNAAIEEHRQGVALRARTAFYRAEMVETLRAALREQNRQRIGWRASLRGAAGSLLVGFGRGQCEPSLGRAARSEQSIAGAMDYIDEHPYLPLRIEAMATRCQLSPRRFTELFRRASGETFNRYLTRKRIEYAQERLGETGHILYACYESGFNDVAYFYRVFKKETGMTPGQFVKASEESGSAV